MISNIRQIRLKQLLEKHRDTFTFHSDNILFDLIEQIQILIEFAFLVEDKPIPQLILGDDLKEADNTASKEIVPEGQIFIKLNRRCYHAQTAENNTKLFQSEGVLLAGKGTIHKTKSFEERLNNNDPIRNQLYYSDNEFIFTIKTKTIKQQYELLSVLERTLNVYAQRLTDEFVVVSGISNIQVKEKLDKDELETLLVYYQFRLKEVSSYNNYYLIEALKIIFNDGDETLQREINSKTISDRNRAVVNLKTLSPDELDKYEKF